VNSGDYSQLAWLWSAQLLGAMGGAALMALHYAAHWTLTSRSGGQAGHLLHQRCGAQAGDQPSERGSGTCGAGSGAFALGSRGVAPNGMGAGMGPWLVASVVWASASRWRDDRLRHQPGARSGSAAGHWLLPIPGKGRIETGAMH